MGSIALAAAVLVAAACGDDDDGGADAVGPLGSFRAALEQVPAMDLEHGTTISWADIDAASELLDLERPEATAEPFDKNAWLLSLSADRDGSVLAPMASLLASGNIDLDGFADELGWSVVDVERFVEVDSPPYRFFLATGGVNLDGDGVEPLDDGLHTAGTGDDLEVDLEARTAARPTGVPLRLALEDGVLAASTTMELVETWRAGDGDSLADEDGYGAVADAIDETGAVGAMAFPNRPAGVPWDADVVGIGWWTEDGDPRASLVFHLRDPGAADDAVEGLDELLREGEAMHDQAMSDLLEVVEVTAADGVVVATIAPTSRHVPLQMLMMQAGPFLPGPGDG